ncbi:5'-nucleotidase [Microdochium trichocladiopsis]|uniref:5'-nucleotidase n=1 Tax=Microdochium trichocladiopsis TaxID=1682393 RepID=A0A9P8YGD9_9PEZI|nr:5'-nucleotidase [Microdochium trichocladiopsis]KAH7038387.1 5'-nucleotidase [Microdochium trichocladiopsis]
MKHTFAAAALAAAMTAGLAVATPSKMPEDMLQTTRMRKRAINADGDFHMSFFHINDVHAHLDEFASSGSDCTNPSRGCWGGYARIKHTIDELRPQQESSLWLNAGDEFQGTLFYSYYKGEKIAETLNQLGFDAMTLGNHEFDGGDDELGEFLLNLTFPVLSANIVSTHPALNQTILPYHIYEDLGVAVIACTTETTASISNPGDGTQFLDVVSSVQRAIDEIRATTDIKRIVALTHIGYDEDQRLARETTGLSLIMGGHSHTNLGTINPAVSEGAYPTIVENAAGDEVFIVTAWRWGQYLGFIDVVFDAEGRAVSYTGGPINMDNTTAQDEGLQAQIDAWRVPFEEFAAEVVGYTNVELVQATCQTAECTLGNVMSDAIQAYRSTAADFSLINAGGIRAAIDVGNITRGEVLTSFPFGNAIVEFPMSGADVLRLLEGCVSRVSQFNGNPITSGFQVSGTLKVQYNPAQPAGSRLVRALVKGVEVDPAATYTVATLDFLAGGGDNIFPKVASPVVLDLQADVLTRYIQAESPIDIAIEGRIETVSEIPGGGGGGGGSSSTITSSSASATSSSSSSSSSASASASASASGSVTLSSSSSSSSLSSVSTTSVSSVPTAAPTSTGGVYPTTTRGCRRRPRPTAN